MSTVGLRRTCLEIVCLYWRSAGLLDSRGPPFSCVPSLDEADLPAQRSSPQAQARLPRAHVHACGPGHPEAAPGEGPEAAVRITPGCKDDKVQRRHRLSRSRDFDAVYRHGRSVSTRFLVLYWFPRDDDGEPRLGIAVPKGGGSAVERNRVKRRIRESWRDRVAGV